MSDERPEHAFTLDELERRLRAHEPRIRLVASRIVRRIIRRTHESSGSGFQIPTRQAFVVDRDILLEHVARRELGAGSENEDALPQTVFLIGRPDEAALRTLPEPAFERLVWRTIFEARVEAALVERALSPAEARARLARLGQVETDEIRAVLTQERRLLPPGTERQLYEAFAAFYLELRFFEPAALSRYFPGLMESPLSLAAVEALLLEDLDAHSIYRASQPGTDAGADAAALDGAHPDPFALEPMDEMPLRQPPEMERSQATFAALVDEARAASEVGNAARAALQFTLAIRAAPADMDAEQVRAATDQVAAELDSLGERLARMTDGATDASAWADALAPLLEPAADGRWSQEARLVYDLQKACVEHERKRYKLDPLGWLLTFERRPLRRPLPNQQLVLAVKHLRQARVRLSSAHIDASARRRLADVVGAAGSHLVGILRARIQETLEQTLDRVGLRATNLPAQVAREKLVDELLDRATERGFLAIGDVRDALSRNELKLHDLRLREFLGSDSLLAADRGLARQLEGIYRPGEIYLRGLQRVSAVTFGTRVGRALTRYLALPFGGAFVILEGLQHIVGPLLGLAGLPQPTLMTRPSVLVLGVVLLGVLHSSAFRSAALTSVRLVGRSVRAALLDAPRWLWRRPLLRRLRATRAAQLVWRFVLKPGFISAVLALAITRITEDTWPVREIALMSGAAFALCNLFLNSRAGRDVEEICFDAAVRTWQQVRWRIVPGILALVLEVFKWLLGSFERLLYRVDERLRFKQGENALVFAFKAIAGLVWGVLTYIARIYITLLVEPQINPIKHFPVVTVSHKIILPFTLQLTALLSAPLTPLLGAVAASTIAGTTVFLLPGVFGFLVWELKENWKLYSANRPDELRPVAIGGHGETMIQFMRPGFHSGTLPKLFARLRRAERRGLYHGQWRRSQKLRMELHHVERALADFVEREFCALLERSPTWGDVRVAIGRIQLGSNRIRVALVRAPDEAPAHLVFEEQSGWLLARVPSSGWLDGLDESRRRVLRSALLGLYKRAGVHLVREQVEALLPTDVSYDVRAHGLVVWPAQDFSLEIEYRGLDSNAARLEPEVTPGDDGSSEGLDAPTLDAERLRFCKASLTWERWVEHWEAERPAPLLPDVRVLPPAPTA